MSKDGHGRKKWMSILSTSLFCGTFVVSSMYASNSYESSKLYQKRMKHLSDAIKIGRVVNGVIPITIPLSQYACLLTQMSICENFFSMFGPILSN